MMDPKIALLFSLIGAVIALSYLSEDNLRRLKRQFSSLGWRQLALPRRKS
jgi:hypothetical protein